MSAPTKGRHRRRETLRRTTVWCLLAALLAGACRDVTRPNEGTYRLRSVDGQPVPVATVQNGSLSLDAHVGEYIAYTCYTIGVDGKCSSERFEVGRFTFVDGLLSLSTVDGYSRTLTVDGATLVQHGSGDTDPANLVYVR